MKRSLSFTLALLIPAGQAFAADNGVLAEMYRFRDLFDGARSGAVDVAPMPNMPVPRSENGSANPWWKQLPGFPADPQDGAWGTPDLQGVPIESPTKQRDVLKEIESCQAVDYVYARQPQAAEVVTALGDCLSELSKRYGVAISAAEGRGGVVFMISGLIPPGSTVKSDLESALQLRGGRLFGHSVKLLDLERPASDRETSSLQPIIDQCGIDVPKLENAPAFVAVFGGCVRGAKGVRITSLHPDLQDEFLVLVYSRDPDHLIREMNGIVRILTTEGVTRLRVQAQSELRSDPLLKTGLPLPTALPR